MVTIPKFRTLTALTRNLLRSATAAAATLLLLGSVVSCSNQTSDKAQSTPTTTASRYVEQAGGGEVESISGGYGTKSNPVPADLVEEEIGHEGSKFLRTARINLCESLDHSVQRHDFNNHGFNATYYEVAYKSGTATLVCSAPQGKIWPLTIGPGTGGVSVPCPSHKPKAVKDVSAVYFKFSDDGTRASSVVHSAGGRGYRNDGLWNYTFHNWNTRDVTPTMWLLCE